MRRPRDYNAELKALDDKARQLRERRVRQLGELVVATGADALPIELLAGALLAAVANSDFVTKEEWRKRGAGFFPGARKPGGQSGRGAHGTSSNDGGAPPASTPARAS